VRPLIVRVVELFGSRNGHEEDRSGGVPSARKPEPKERENDDEGRANQGGCQAGCDHGTDDECTDPPSNPEYDRGEGKEEESGIRERLVARSKASEVAVERPQVCIELVSVVVQAVLPNDLLKESDQRDEYGGDDEGSDRPAQRAARVVDRETDQEKGERLGCQPHAMGPGDVPP
jgi:hypothetical protein